MRATQSDEIYRTAGRNRNRSRSPVAHGRRSRGHRDEEEAEVEDVANYLVMDLSQEAWIEISTKDQWVAA